MSSTRLTQVFRVSYRPILLTLVIEEVSLLSEQTNGYVDSSTRRFLDYLDPPLNVSGDTSDKNLQIQSAFSVNNLIKRLSCDDLDWLEPCQREPPEMQVRYANYGIE